MVGIDKGSIPDCCGSLSASFLFFPYFSPPSSSGPLLLSLSPPPPPLFLPLCTLTQIGMTIHCRILRVNLDKFSVDLTCRSSDLADREGKFRCAGIHI